MAADVSHCASRLSKDQGEFAKQKIIYHQANCMENTQPSSFRVEVESQKSMEHSRSRVASITEDAERAVMPRLKRRHDVFHAADESQGTLRHDAPSPLNSASPYYQIAVLSYSHVGLSVTCAALRYEHGVLGLGFDQSMGRMRRLHRVEAAASLLL